MDLRVFLLQGFIYLKKYSIKLFDLKFFDQKHIFYC